MPPGQFVSPSSETSTIQIFLGGNSPFINPFDETKFSCFYRPLTQNHYFLWKLEICARWFK